MKFCIKIRGNHELWRVNILHTFESARIDNLCTKMLWSFKMLGDTWYIDFLLVTVGKWRQAARRNRFEGRLTYKVALPKSNRYLFHRCISFHTYDYFYTFLDLYRLTNIQAFLLFVPVLTFTCYKYWNLLKLIKLWNPNGKRNGGLRIRSKRLKVALITEILKSRETFLHMKRCINTILVLSGSYEFKFNFHKRYTITHFAVIL